MQRLAYHRPNYFVPWPFDTRCPTLFLCKATEAQRSHLLTKFLQNDTVPLCDCDIWTSDGPMTHMPQMPCHPLHVIPWIRDFTPRPFILFEMLKDQGDNIQDAFFVDEQSLCDETIIVAHWASYKQIDIVRAPANLACSLSPGANGSHDNDCWHPSVLPFESHLRPWPFYESSRKIKTYRSVDSRLPVELTELVLDELRVLEISQPAKKSVTIMKSTMAIDNVITNRILSALDPDTQSGIIFSLVPLSKEEMGCFNESLRGLGCTIYNVTSKDLENHHTLEHVSRDLLQAKGVHGVLFVDSADLIITKQDANATYVYALRCATGDDIGTIFESPQFQRLHIDQLGYWAGYSRFCVAALHTYDEQSSRRGRDLSRPTEIILDPALPHSRVKPLPTDLVVATVFVFILPAVSPSQMTMIRTAVYAADLDNTTTWIFVSCDLKDGSMEELIDLYDSGRKPQFDHAPSNFIALDAESIQEIETSFKLSITGQRHPCRISVLVASAWANIARHSQHITDFLGYGFGRTHIDLVGPVMLELGKRSNDLTQREGTVELELMVEPPLQKVYWSSVKDWATSAEASYAVRIC